MDFEVAGVVDFVFEGKGQGGSGGDGETGVFGDGVGFEPGGPEGWDGGECQVWGAGCGLGEWFGEWGTGEDEGDAVEEERGDQVEEAVGMSHGEGGEVGPFRAESHGVADLVGIGSDLFFGEEQILGGSGGGGRALDVGDPGRDWSGEGGEGLSGVEGAEWLPVFPGLEDLEDELDACGLGDGGADIGWVRIGREGIGGVLEVGEGPGFARADVPHGGLAGVMPREVEPAVVEHCGLSSRPVGSAASMLSFCPAGFRFFRWVPLIWVVLVGVGLAGCSVTRPPGSVAKGRRGFDVVRDVSGVTNELRWVYRVQEGSGRVVHAKREPPPTFSLRCFGLAAMARAFYLQARFEPAAPGLDERGLEERVRQVMARGARAGAVAEKDRVVIPGFTDLRELSGARPELVKSVCGGAWRSYVQRGHWRMLLPFTPGQCRRVGDRLAEVLAAGEPVVVHVEDFPKNTLNHAVLAYAVSRRGDRGDRVFQCYDPNEPGRVLEIVDEGGSGLFRYPVTPYFRGGQVFLYVVMRDWWN